MASKLDENGVSPQVEENDAELDRKRELMTGKLQKREDERLEDVQRRKDESESSKAANESTDLFLKKFSQAKSQVEEMLEKSNGLSKTQLTPHFDEILVLITKMQKYMTDSMIFLTAFDGRKAQESVGKIKSQRVLVHLRVAGPQNMPIFGLICMVLPHNSPQVKVLSTLCTEGM